MNACHLAASGTNTAMQKKILAQFKKLSLTEESFPEPTFFSKTINWVTLCMTINLRAYDIHFLTNASQANLVSIFRQFFISTGTAFTVFQSEGNFLALNDC